MSLLQQIRHYKPSALTLTTLMYGVLCLIQLVNLRVPRDASPQLYQQLIDCSDSSGDIILRKNDKLINEFIKQSKQYGIESIGTLKSLNVQHRTIRLIAFIDSISKSIYNSDFNKDRYISNATNSRIQDSISLYIDTSINLLRTEAREEFSAAINNNVWQIRNSPDWLTNLFTYQRKEEAIAILSVIKLNIIKTSHYTINEILQESEQFYFCGFSPERAIALPLQAYVFKGSYVHALMTVAVYGTWYNINVSYTANSGKITKVENGVATLTTTAPSAGIHILSGTGSVERGDSIRTLPWQTQYYVAPKGIYMHIDNANKCYAGIPFNMTIGLEEYSSDKLSLRSKDAVIKKLNDNTYTITARKGVKSFMVYMDAINDDGSKSTSVAAKHIIVLQPTPDIAIGDIKHGLINKSYISQHTTLSAISKDEDLDITYNIKQYDISYIKAGNKYTAPVTIHGNTLSNTNTMQSGDRIFITDVIATDNYGNTHHIPATSFRVE